MLINYNYTLCIQKCIKSIESTGYRSTRREMATAQGFCLKSNNHSSHLVHQFARLYKDQSMVDCTISCQGGVLKCHKLVLSSCSPYFSNIFESFTNPYQYPVVVIKDMTFSNLKVIIDFMYKGEVTIPQSILNSVIETAKELQVTGLCDVKVCVQCI